MTYPVSACVFIRNNNKGGFCLWESIASLMSYVSEFIVLDLGSNDGTLETLQEIERRNKKFSILSGEWPKQDAESFAILANEIIRFCKYDNVLYYQADEVWHPDLLKIMGQKFEEGIFDLTFWRVQFKYNFQHIKWWPHPVHRVGPKDNFNFVNDGMNTDRTYGVQICSDYNMGWFQKWGDLGENIKPYINQMITDVSQTGGFLNTIINKRRLHAPFWGNEGMVIENIPAEEWYQVQKDNPDWTKKESPYNIPRILRWHLGNLTYLPRSELIEGICNNDTHSFVFED